MRSEVFGVSNEANPEEGISYGTFSNTQEHVSRRTGQREV